MVRGRKTERGSAKGGRTNGRNEMIDLLPGAVSDLLEAGLTPEELSLYTGMTAEDVMIVAAGGEAASMTAAAAIRLGKIIYLLEHLKERQVDPRRITLRLQVEALDLALQEYLNRGSK